MPYFWQRRTVNTPDEKALNFSYAFLGVRLECAQCHKHPFDQWTQDDFKQFTAFFQPIRFGINPESRKRAVALREELGLNKLMGGELQRETAKLVKAGKVIPFQEVFVVKTAAQAAPRGNKKAQAQAGNGRVATPKLLGGDRVDLAKVDDPRQPLMDWLRSKDEPILRPRVRQPRLGQRLRTRDRQPDRRHEPRQRRRPTPRSLTISPTASSRRATT